MTENLLLVVVFLAVALITMALWMLIRDLFSRRYNISDKRLPIDAAPEEIRRFTRQQKVHHGPLDRPFYQLVDESGTKLDAPTVLMLIVGIGIIGGGIAFVYAEDLLATAGGLALGTILPIVWFTIKRWRRIREMRVMLPEALQIVADSVRAGHNLEQASELAALEIKEPLREEFMECSSQLKLGNSPTSVMERMTRRIPLPEFRVFATAVMVHQTAGGNLGLLTERLSHSALEHQEFLGHVNAVTAGSRLSAIGMVIGSAAAMLALTWLQPEYVRAFIDSDIGPYLLALAITLQIIGALWVWRISRVTY